MLYVFVNKERTVVYFATYDIDDALNYSKKHNVELAEAYFDSVEIYAVIDDEQ